ncbi:hypothetical protein Tco_0444972 [Tanacetum coccineum]
MASAAAKPCQGDSSELYLITANIYTDQRGTVAIATVFDEVTKTLSSISLIITNLNLQVLPTIGAADSRRLKNFKKDATLKLFKSTNQERCSRSHSRQVKEQAQDLKFMITTSNYKLIIEVKDHEHKTKVEA